MTSTKPYMLRAFYEWIVDNGLTPYVVVDTRWPNVDVPVQYVKDNQIVLNMSPTACINFSLDLEAVSFQARFGGQPTQVFFPTGSVSAIYAKENGAGTVFTEELPETSRDDERDLKLSERTEKPSSDGQLNKPKQGKASLKLIK